MSFFFEFHIFLGCIQCCCCYWAAWMGWRSCCFTVHSYWLASIRTTDYFVSTGVLSSSLLSDVRPPFWNCDGRFFQNYGSLNLHSGDIQLSWTDVHSWGRLSGQHTPRTPAEEAVSGMSNGRVGTAVFPVEDVARIREIWASMGTGSKQQMNGKHLIYSLKSGL